jgi:hypothetical protein
MRGCASSRIDVSRSGKGSPDAYQRRSPANPSQAPDVRRLVKILEAGPSNTHQSRTEPIQVAMSAPKEPAEASGRPRLARSRPAAAGGCPATSLSGGFPPRQPAIRPHQRVIATQIPAALAPPPRGQHRGQKRGPRMLPALKKAYAGSDQVTQAAKTPRRDRLVREPPPISRKCVATHGWQHRQGRNAREENNRTLGTPGARPRPVRRHLALFALSPALTLATAPQLPLPRATPNAARSQRLG